MAKRQRSSYTFAVTIPNVTGVTVKQLRQFLKDAISSEYNAGDPSDWIKELELEKVKIHLTNKETSYA